MPALRLLRILKIINEIVADNSSYKMPTHEELQSHVEKQGLLGHRLTSPHSFYTLCLSETSKGHMSWIVGTSL